MTAQSNSIAYVQAGSHRYPLITERRCRTCTHPERIRVETEVVQGRPWSAILRDLPQESGLSARGIRNHFVRGHLPIEEEAVVRLAERQAEQRGEVVAAGVDVLVEHADFASTVLGRVNHLVRNGEANPTVRDGLAAATLLARLQAERSTFDEDDLARVILIHLQAAEDTLPAEQCQAYLERVAADPVMQGMSARWEKAYGAAAMSA